MSELLTPVNAMIGLGLYLFVCGLGGIYISTQKNRDGMEGFLLSVLFGPAGLIAAACLPDRSGRWPAAAEDDDQAEEEEAKVKRAIAGMTAPDRPPAVPPASRRRKLMGEVEE